MNPIRIGIQGDMGSTNERACLFFAEKYGWENIEILYLLSTENVLRALEEGKIDYGTFAWSSQRAGLVAETQEAIQKYKYKKIDEHAFQIDHALLSCSSIDIEKRITLFSHPQAIKEHASFLRKIFPNLIIKEEIDTAIAAKKLYEGKYPKNSLVIAPIACAKIYHLEIFLPDLPSNREYFTTIFLVKKYS